MLAQADLNNEFPLKRTAFDALLCSLVSEHLTNLSTFFAETFAVLKHGGRFVFSAFHPEIALAGVEANFEQDGIEYRLGAEPHSVDDYLNRMDDAGFRDVRAREYAVDETLVAEIPWAVKYLGRPLLLVVDAARPLASTASGAQTSDLLTRPRLGTGGCERVCAARARSVNVHPSRRRSGASVWTTSTRSDCAAMTASMSL